MTGWKHLITILSIFGSTCALYESDSAVIELTANNFQNRVINSDALWIVEFYASTYGHCGQSLAPEYAKVAKVLMGAVNIGGVNMDEHKSVGGPYNVCGFPTIKIFGMDKNKPLDYNGPRTAQGIVDKALAELSAMVRARLSGKKSSGGGSEAPKGDENDVVELTDENFAQLVINSEEPWLVEFFAPWSSNCKNLAPHWASAATQLKGKMKLGAVDATVHTVMAGRFNVRGFPTIKYFPAGKKSMDEFDDEQCGKTSWFKWYYVILIPACFFLPFFFCVGMALLIGPKNRATTQENRKFSS